MKNRFNALVNYAAMILLSVGSLSCTKNTDKPNVLFIAVDDLRPELNCYGYDQIKSPNIDKLAAEGVMFTRAYCQQAVCGPSRLSIMTGMHPDALGVFGMSAHNIIEWRETRKGITSLPEQFRKNGYYALCIGKIYDYRLGLDKGFSWDSLTGNRLFHFVDPENLKLATQRNLDLKAKKANPQRWPATECYDTTDVAYTDGNSARIAIDFLNNRDKSKPFFLSVGFVKPHLPFVAPKKYWDMYERESIPLPEKNEPLDGFSPYTLSPYKEIFDFDVNGQISDILARQLRHGYYACISYVDAQIGKLIETLKQNGDLENTIIVLWGDHGFKLGDYGEWAKNTNLETDTRVPLILRLPHQKHTAIKSASVVELVDVLPTVCQAAGLVVPSNAEGQSLLPLVDDPNKEIHDFALSQFPRADSVMGYSIRTANWRYTEWIHRKTGETIARELYKMDGGKLMEDENVVDKYKTEADAHSQMLHDYLKVAPKWKGKPHG